MIGGKGDVADLFDGLVVHQLGNALDQAGFVDLVGQFGDDDTRLATPRLLGMDLAAHDNATFAAPIGFLDPLRAKDNAGGWEIGTADKAH